MSNMLAKYAAIAADPDVALTLSSSAASSVSASPPSDAPRRLDELLLPMHAQVVFVDVQFTARHVVSSYVCNAEFQVRQLGRTTVVQDMAVVNS